MPNQTNEPNNKDVQEEYSLRSILPIPDRPYQGFIPYDAKDPDAKFPPIQPLRPPSGAPNVLIVLIDDAGFGSSTAFGGPCRTPNAERVAAGGLKYTRFHTTALCSPTRAALLSGRNHHVVGMGGVTEIASSAPGYNSMRPNTCTPLAEILRLNGYATGQFGKCHEVPVWETSPGGPFDRWPTGSGFQHFYGFVGGEANQWYPTLYQDTAPVEPWGTPEEGYHLVPDMTDKAITWIHQQKALTPDQPFFVYFAPGATHAPHHVPKEWADKYRGRFDQGWDRLREETFTRQKQLGVIPQDCELTKRPAEIPAWDDMPNDLKPVLARQMEVYAGYMEFTDHHAGRLLDTLDELGITDNTLIYYIIGDNGASAEGTLQGTFNEMINFNGAAALETAQFMMERLDQFGGPNSYNHYAVGWAHAMDTPYQWTKQVASHWGGTRNGTIIHWPRGIQAQGEMRHQFTHVIDIAPTILEAAGLPEPVQVHGVTQTPLQGVSMVYSFNDVQAPERHDTQYFEMFGNRGIYHRGWSAVTKHKTPWLLVGEKTVPFDDDVWELYDGSKDWTQAKDLSKEMPDKLHELQRLWLIEATRNNVLPMDDRVAERMNADAAGRPTLIHGKTQVLFQGMGHLNENCMVNIKNKSHSVTAELIVHDGTAEGVIINQGGNAGGWVLYVKEGKPAYCYNFLGLQQFKIVADRPLSQGEHQLRMEFVYDGGGLGKGGTATLFIDRNRVASGRVERTEAIIFSADDAADVGLDAGSPVTEDYLAHHNAFNGTVKWVQIDLGSDDHDHLIAPEERLRVAVARQ